MAGVAAHSGNGFEDCSGNIRLKLSAHRVKAREYIPAQTAGILGGKVIE